MGWEGMDARDVSNTGLRFVLEALRRQGGEDAVAAVLARAGEKRSVLELVDDSGWSTYDQFRAILEAVTDTVGVELLHGIADQHLLAGARPATLMLLESAATPSTLYRQVVEAGVDGITLFCQVGGEEVGPNEWLLETRTRPGYEPFPALCAFHAGMAPMAVELFGSTPWTVVEEACQRQGADACRYRIRWGDRDDVAERIAALEHSNLALRGQLASLQDMLDALVHADDLESFLEGLVVAAADVMRTPAFVLAVAPLAGIRRRVFAEGLTAEEADRIAGQLLAGEACPEADDMVVDIESHRRWYGRFAACSQDGRHLSRPEQLHAFAALVAVALDMATALDSTRREAARAQQLLALADALDGATTVAEVADSLVEALPIVVEADQALVCVPEAGGVRVVAASGVHAGGAGVDRTTVFPTSGNESETGIRYFDPRVRFPDAAGIAAAVVPLVVGGAVVAWLVVEVLEGEHRLAPSEDLEARLRGLAAQASSAFRQAQLLEEMHHLAHHDTLTGLPNRTVAHGRAALLLERPAGRVSALFVDLDGFKELNDTLGHAAGDQLLQVIAERLAGTIRDVDTVARIGGDEFVLVIDGGDPEQVAARILDVLEEPIHLGSRDTAPVFVSASIGIATASGHVSADDLLRDADLAMYQAKATGKRRFVTFAPELRRVVRDRRELEADLRRAVDEGQFFLLYQPIVELRSGEVTGMEALLRWRHPERGVVGPDRFIPVLEETGLICVVGRWVLEEACRQTAAWQAMGQDLYVSVNLSARQLDGGGLVDDVAAVLSMTGLRPGSLVLELTETTLMEDTVAATRCLDGLKALGVRVALDDFGTGYSSLSYLRQLPIDILKIDRSFISTSSDSPEAAACVHMLVQLGQSLGLRTLAEGVERDEQLDRLAREGCDDVQGYLFSRPLAAADVPVILAAGLRPRAR
jgi:diguanylate cyclase (GGDEF)-like protein